MSFLNDSDTTSPQNSERGSPTNPAKPILFSISRTKAGLRNPINVRDAEPIPILSATLSRRMRRPKFLAAPPTTEAMRVPITSEPISCDCSIHVLARSFHASFSANSRLPLLSLYCSLRFSMKADHDVGVIGAERIPTTSALVTLAAERPAIFVVSISPRFNPAATPSLKASFVNFIPALAPRDVILTPEPTSPTPIGIDDATSAVKPTPLPMVFHIDDPPVSCCIDSNSCVIS